MATYKRRGYKSKTNKQEQANQNQDSTTAEVFSSLDETASKTEQWVAKYQKYILASIVGVAVSTICFLGYSQYVLQPKEIEAANELYYPQQYFELALQDGTAKDSLLTLALYGGEGKYGFIDIIEEYSGTKAANMAEYGAGMASLNLKDYQNAISYLDGFSSDDAILGALAKGGVGDAFSQLDQYEDALEYYIAAFDHSDNSFTTPKFLYKAAVLAIELGQKSKAKSYIEEIKSKYPDSAEGQYAEALAAMLKA
ncbi:MAG: hypothetical protein CMC18_05105 [Flavobacteriaceae bacterium]|nr:hypothetical protein [Flavobacteriaceae bacterium]